jgi:signal transduction histidine kinase
VQPKSWNGWNKSLTTAIVRECDVAAARGAVRDAGLTLGFSPRDLRLVQAVASEMCLYALARNCPAWLSVSALNRAGRTGISLAMQYPVEITEGESRDDTKTPGLGLAGAKRLSDRWEISIRAGKTTIEAIKWLPGPEPAGDLATRYLRIIETAPEEAWEFGRQAVMGGLGITAMAAIHAGAMARSSSPAKAQQCFEEALAAFDMVYRGVDEARVSLHRIHTLLERETERIAQSLHDEAAQIVAALALGVDGLESGDPAHTLRLKALVEEAGNLFRALSHELRPPLLEQEGLARALEALCKSFSSRRGLKVEFLDDLGRRPDPPLERTIYGTVQTALANVVRHAGAANVVVRLYASDASVLCSVRDNGRGLDAEQRRSAGLGLRGVRERAAALGGTIELEAVLPHGLEIRVRLPEVTIPGFPR